MRAWEIHNVDDIRLIEDTTVRGEGEVKVKIAKVGISSSDFAEAAKGDSDTPIIGHSAVGYVSEADENMNLQLGEKVIVSPYLSTKSHGRDVVDILGIDRPGFLRDFISTSFDNVFLVPPEVKDDEIIFIDYISMAERVLVSFEAQKGDYVVIIGASTLGLILAQLCLYYQYIPIIIDMDDDKLNLAKQYGIYYTLNSADSELHKRVKEITGGRMADALIFGGESFPTSKALRLVKYEGNVITAGFSSHAKLSLDGDTILYNQLSVKGICHGEGEVSTAINLLVNKIVKTKGLITKKIKFKDVPEIVKECAESPYKYNRILITID